MVTVKFDVYSVEVFPLAALVMHVQNDEDYNSFYAEAVVTLTWYVEYAEIQLRRRFECSCRSVKRRKSGDEYVPYQRIGTSPFKAGDTMRVFTVKRIRVVNAQSFKIGSQ